MKHKLPKQYKLATTRTHNKGLNETTNPKLSPINPQPIKKKFNPNDNTKDTDLPSLAIQSRWRSHGSAEAIEPQRIERLGGGGRAGGGFRG